MAEDSGQTSCRDFAKAFDKVNHSLLLHKLDHYGVRGQVNRWIAGFLQDRKQAVVADGAKSDSVAVKSGVPQGSVLGPSLFMVYINDLPGTVSSPVQLLADDTAIYRPITTGQDQTHKLPPESQGTPVDFICLLKNAISPIHVNSNQPNCTGTLATGQAMLQRKEYQHVRHRNGSLG